jgi:hypothetical protein
MGGMNPLVTKSCKVKWEANMNAGSASVDASRLRRRLVDFLGGIRHWAAAANARRKLRAEIDALDSAGVLDDTLRDFNMSRSDVEAIVNADPEGPRRLEEMLEWLALADRLRGDERGWSRDIQVVCLKCQTAGQCDYWLRGDRKGGIEEFCPNAETFKALRG